MLLVIDCGNTNVVFAVREGDTWRGTWRIRTDAQRTSDEYGVLAREMFSVAGIDHQKIDGLIIASVVPPLNFTFKEMSKAYFAQEAMFVDNNLDLGLPILYHPASDVGADRIVDAVAAIARYGSPCIVVDFGTATTFDAINSKGEYLGGVLFHAISAAVVA